MAASTAFPHTCRTYAIAFVPARSLIERRGAQPALLAAPRGGVNACSNAVSPTARLSETLVGNPLSGGTSRRSLPPDRIGRCSPYSSKWNRRCAAAAGMDFELPGVWHDLRDRARGAQQGDVRGRGALSGSELAWPLLQTRIARDEVEEAAHLDGEIFAARIHRQQPAREKHPLGQHAFQPSPTCIDAKRPAKYPPISGADFLRSRLEPTYRATG